MWPLVYVCRFLKYSSKHNDMVNKDQHSCATWDMYIETCAYIAQCIYVKCISCVIGPKFLKQECTLCCSTCLGWHVDCAFITPVFKAFKPFRIYRIWSQVCSLHELSSPARYPQASPQTVSCTAYTPGSPKTRKDTCLVVKPPDHLAGIPTTFPNVYPVTCINKIFYMYIYMCYYLKNI